MQGKKGGTQAVKIALRASNAVVFRLVHWFWAAFRGFQGKAAFRRGLGSNPEKGRGREVKSDGGGVEKRKEAVRKIQTAGRNFVVFMVLAGVLFLEKMGMTADALPPLGTSTTDEWRKNAVTRLGMDALGFVVVVWVGFFPVAVVVAFGYVMLCFLTFLAR